MKGFGGAEQMLPVYDTARIIAPQWQNLSILPDCGISLRLCLDSEDSINLQNALRFVCSAGLGKYVRQIAFRVYFGNILIIIIVSRDFRELKQLKVSNI